MVTFPRPKSAPVVWWGTFGLLVVAPALVLALLGLSAVRAEQIEREHQRRQQQQQLARLADAALANRLADLEAELRHASSSASDLLHRFETLPDVPFFEFNRQGLLTFYADRVYFGEFGMRPELLAAHTAWTGTTRQLIDQALAAEAQGRSRDAASLYRSLMRAEPKLRTWAELGAARARSQTVTAALREVSDVKDEHFVEALTPQGLPVALLTSMDVEHLPETRQAAFLPFLRQTLAHLRNGRWWLSYAERQFYDAALRRLMAGIDPDHSLSEDARLRELASIERTVRNHPPYQRDAVTRSLVRRESDVFLLLWAPSDRAPDTWIGAAVPSQRLQTLLDEALQPLLSDQPFAAALRDRHGQFVWGQLPGETPVTQAVRLESIPEWEIVFSAVTKAGWANPRRMLWYGFILLLVMMLGTGVTMTLRVVRRELELGRLQNEFVAAVSHEFKSPIAGIRLLVERLAARRARSEEQADLYFATIGHELDRLDRLVSRLLVSQQLQAGRKQYRFERACLEEIARHVLELLKPQAEAKAMQLVLEVKGDARDVVLDRASITDALENLVDNAVKYSPARTDVTVELRFEPDEVSIRVCDQGAGIEPNEQERIFEKFYRGRRGDQHDVRGTGLGLALVKATAAAHQGTVSVSSTPGEGSCFTLTLPTHLPEHTHGTDPDR